MKTIRDVSDFFNEFTYYDHYNIERVIDLNHIRFCVIDALSNCYVVNENLRMRVLGTINDISLMVIDGNVESLNQEIFILK